MSTISIRNPPIIIGHRGSAERIENTLESFRDSIEQGSQMLEMDVRLSRDGVPHVIHDSTFRRITGGKSGTVASRTSKHIRGLDLGDGSKIPTLEETLTEIAPLVPINLELKYNKPKYRPLAEGVVEVVSRMKLQHRILVSSFFHPSLKILRKQIPELMTAPLFGSLTGPPHDDDLEELFAEPLHPKTELPFKGRVAVLDHQLVDEALVAKFRDHDATLLVYTVDKPSEVARMFKLGIDGMITNRPALALRIFETLSS